MNTTVLITIIICATLILLCIIGVISSAISFHKTRKDMNKVFDDFKDIKF